MERQIYFKLFGKFLPFLGGSLKNTDDDDDGGGETRGFGFGHHASSESVHVNCFYNSPYNF